MDVEFKTYSIYVPSQDLYTTYTIESRYSEDEVLGILIDRYNDENVEISEY